MRSVKVRPKMSSELGVMGLGVVVWVMVRVEGSTALRRGSLASGARRLERRVVVEKEHLVVVERRAGALVALRVKRVRSAIAAAWADERVRAVLGLEDQASFWVGMPFSNVNGCE